MMTIREAENFYKSDNFKYNLKKNPRFLEWYKELKDNGYISYMNINSLQEFIDKLVIWYEIKYPERELDKEDGVNYSDFRDLKELSQFMTMEQLVFRLDNNENCLLNGVYRTGCGGFRYNKDKGRYVPNLYIKFRRLENESEGYPLFYKNEYGLHFDGDTGKITSFDNMPCELILEDDMTIERLLAVLSKMDKFDLTNIRKCIKLHETDEKLRDVILQYAALKMLYSENTIPTHGYKRAKKFILEFNNYFNLNLNDKEIDYLINKDYSDDSLKSKKLDDNKLNSLVKEQKVMLKRLNNR
ncbi:MAG: hypothetical protein IJ068_01670 [Bacilli bacterium]|nr:hypothetical protein [Bacilli bacterium]